MFCSMHLFRELNPYYIVVQSSPRSPESSTQFFCTYLTSKGKERVWKTRRKYFKARAEGGFHYFCSHLIDQNSVTGFHLTIRNAGKCSLYTWGEKKMGLGKHLALPLPQGHLTVRYNTEWVNVVEINWWNCVNSTNHELSLK